MRRAGRHRAEPSPKAKGGEDLGTGAYGQLLLGLKPRSPSFIPVVISCAPTPTVECTQALGKEAFRGHAALP